MIYPSAIDVMNAIIETHENVLRPSLTGSMERSAAATISHLLRHVSLRIEHEGQTLTDDIAQTRALVAEVKDYLAQFPEQDAQTCAAFCAEATQRQFRPQGAYPSLASLGEEAGNLRAAVTSALEFLQSIRSEQGGTHAYQAIRARIRHYIVSQIQHEADLVEPAFAGHGPRR